jgi:hypothetical protein
LLSKATIVLRIGELWATRRRLDFFYDILVLLLLLVVAVLYVEFKGDARVKDWIPYEYTVFVHSMWLGSLGGVIISLKGVYGNACDPPWSNCYNLWHLGRPFSGAVTGLVTVLIFLFITQGTGFNRPVVYLAAFILGTQEARFFTFLFEIGRIIVQVPPSLKPPAGLRVTAVEPAVGPPGTLVILAGQGLERNAVVKLGGMALDKPVVSPDGSSAAGTVPKLGGATRAVDVTVLNPSGSSVVLPDRFRYTGDQQ